MTGPACNRWHVYGFWACLTPATHNVTGGCVREHMRPGVMCDEHTAEYLAGELTCAHPMSDDPADEWCDEPLRGRATPIPTTARSTP